MMKSTTRMIFLMGTPTIPITEMLLMMKKVNTTPIMMLERRWFLRTIQSIRGSRCMR